jgi:hypothetical protein
MKINLIDLEKYSYYPELLSFIESMKSFDINKAIETLKNNIVKTTTDDAYEYWFHIVGTEKERGYFTNLDYSGENIDLSKLVGDWKYIKFQAQDVDIPDIIKDMFVPYLKNLKDFPYEIHIHSISHGTIIEDHIDKPDVAVGESSNRNLIVNLCYPKNVTVDQAAIYVNKTVITPEEFPEILFDSQYPHGAWNHTNETWTFLVFYVPTDHIEAH